MSEPRTARLSDRSRSAIENAWKNRFHRWRAYALSLTGNPTDADEIVQEAITRTMRAAPPLENEQEAYQYVIVAIRSSAYRMFARRGRRRQLSGELADEAVTSDALNKALTAEKREHQRRMTRAALAVVSRLAPLHRQTIELLVLRDPPMKLREVASIQNAPISTVYSRLQAALRCLATDLAQELE